MKKNSLSRNHSAKKSFNFTIAPATTSETPYQIQAGKTVVFRIQVTNQSILSDLIFLKCPELPADWFTIAYLDHTVEETPGIIQLSEKLSLPPQSSGEIQLTLHPPRDAAIGNYFPTLQLISMSAPDLVILDVIYLQVLPDTHLDTQLIPESQAIANQPATFNFIICNRGNVHRTLKLDAKDSANLFRFETDLANNIVKLAPGQEITIALNAAPRNPWQRPLGGSPIRSQIGVTLVAVDALAEARSSTQGKLVWLPQPQWVRGLLTLLGAAGALLALAGLYRFNRPAIAAPEIVRFTATGQNEALRLNWKLNNPETLARVVIAQLNDGAEIQTVRYDFSASIPKGLQAKPESDQGCQISQAQNHSSALWQLPLPNLPWFQSLQQTPTPTTIDCQNIPFNSKQASSLRYKLKLFSKSDAQVPSAEYTTAAIAPKLGGDSSQVELSLQTAQPSQLFIVLNVNGNLAQSQPIHTYSVTEGGTAEIVVSWMVQGSRDIRLLPGSSNVQPNGSATYLLRAGESKTVTLAAQNSVGERVTQSVVIAAAGIAARDRSPFRPNSPFQPAQKPSPGAGDPLPPEPENTQPSETDQPPSDQSSPPADIPSPEASPAASP
ncbi:MAG: hypothetical protein MUC48_09965 [Leptolyngbya sp. Prado105]|nr:hypothetical protein [Leptolyngbya sp. Prado105]